MAFVEWSDDLSVGVVELDEQHKKLIEIMNRAYSAKLEKDSEEGEDIFNELIEYVRVHFETEEKMFEKCSFSGAEEHIAEHVSLTEKVLEFKGKYDEGECDCSKFLEFLKEWFEDHLKNMDSKYVSTFKECGLR